MTDQPFLTVGIPTFNRAEAIATRVSELGELAKTLDIEIVVSDNGSPDDTRKRLASPPKGVRVVGSDENLGFARNLFRVIDETRTPYLTVISDEDQVSADGLAALMEFCRSRKPGLVSPRAQVGTNSAYRGRRATRLLTPVDYQPASFYLSGLTFDTSSVQRSLEVVRTLVPDNSAATVYPQVLLAALAIAQGNSYFLDELVTTQVIELETHITESSGASYRTIAGRWAQCLGYESFFGSDLTSVVGTAGTPRILEMREEARRGALKLLLKAALAESPAFTPYFQRSALRYGLDALVARIRRR